MWIPPCLAHGRVGWVVVSSDNTEHEAVRVDCGPVEVRACPTGNVAAIQSKRKQIQDQQKKRPDRKRLFTCNKFEEVKESVQMGWGGGLVSIL
jgi:hypothetical protein